jgi:cellulose synthase/poly-beta-1,6-N-acetylglucosamine synthase-like glycosyltransferase
MPFWGFGSRVLLLFANAESVFGAVVFAIVCLLLVFFWLAGAYLLCTVLFSFLPVHEAPRLPTRTQPSVALLYTTCDDFQADAASSCLGQDYPNYHLFILDDGEDEDVRRELDSFCVLHRESTTLVRRGTREHFKAGNVNHALRTVASAYEFFALVDADEHLPQNFLRRACDELQRTGCAFAQANHAPNHDQPSRFARDLAPTMRALWDVFCRPKNRFGFVACLGHGVVIRRRSWEAVGGFPEVVTEDYAFSAALAGLGQRGTFLPSLVCGEDFPPNYPAFKRRQEKYVVGATQSIVRYGWRVLRAPGLSLVEKIDFFLWSVPLYIPVVCLAYLLISLVAAAFAQSHWRIFTLEFGRYSWASPPLFLGSRPVGALLDWDFQIFSAAWALAPALACLVVSIRYERQFLRLLAASMTPYMSVMVVAWRGILRLVLTGAAHFVPTGLRPGSSTPKRSRVWSPLHASEILLGVLLSVASLVWLNAALFGISSSIWVGTSLDVFGWESRANRLLCFAAFACVVLQCALVLAQPAFSWLALPIPVKTLGRLYP